MNFLRVKVFKNNFVTYITSLLVICIVLGASLCSRVINDQLQKDENAAMGAFDRIEANLNLNQTRIDNYILYLYNSKLLLRDFLCFFGHDADSYLTGRLDSTNGNTQISSVLDDLQQFAANNQFIVKEIAFQSPEATNLMFFKENQNTSFQFCLPNKAPVLPEDDISFGYVYSRKLVNPDNISKPMGQIKFILNVDKVVSGAVNYGIGSTAVMSARGALYYPSKQGGATKEDFQRILSENNVRGEIRNGFFNTVYYSVFTSKVHGFKFVSAVTTAEIIENNRGMFFLIIFGTLFIFGIMTVLIAAFMTRDAKYLNRILSTIGEAKCGDFKAIEIGKRKDEYGMIAQALNDMYAQLNHYIETEYKLKLQQKDTQMKMLQRQVNPHFLYNTLEIIRSCALVNRDEEVADAIFNLGTMFRDVVKSEDVITVNQELEILTRYLKLMEFKFKGSFYYQIDVAPEIRTLETVKFWMQPLSENFFVHGYDKNSQFNLLIVSGTCEPDFYEICITNNGGGIEPQKLEQINRQLRDGPDGGFENIGLMNVRTRLNYFYDNRVDMTVSNNPEAGITVSVRIYKEENHVPASDC